LIKVVTPVIRVAWKQVSNRKMIGEARKNGMLGAAEASSLTEVPNMSQKGTRLGNWPTREQAKELLAVPDRSTLKGKRDYVILALLVGCALRRNELAELDIETIQQREGRWVLADLEGKGRRIRTVAVPIWVKQGIDAWTAAAEIDKGRLLRSVSKSGKVNRDSLSDWSVWSVVEQSSKHIGIEHSVPTTSAVPAPSSAGRTAAIWSRSSFCSGTPRSRPPSAI
jgi:integrase